MIVVGDRKIAWQPGLTLARLVDALPDGELCMVVRLNGKLVSRTDFEHTEVPDEAEVTPLPLIVGG